MILVKDELTSSTLDLGSSNQIPSIVSHTCDAVACRIAVGKDQSIGVLCIYRPPSCSQEGNSNMMQLISEFINYKFKYNVIVGDFNFPEINWPLNALSSQGTVFLDFCQKKSFAAYYATDT